METGSASSKGKRNDVQDRDRRPRNVRVGSLSMTMGNGKDAIGASSNVMENDIYGLSGRGEDGRR